MSYSPETLRRPKVFNMRMSAEEWDRLESLARHYSLNAAGIVRMLVKRECDALASQPKPAKPSRK